MDLKKGEFYVGRTADDQPLTYKADNLTTHGVIVGMTGSGKTGLGVNFLEEALLNNIPTLIIDPKGDMGNLILNFPDHNPSDFEPWVDDAKATLQKLHDVYAPDALLVDDIDGYCFEFADWRFNIRMSNTEPVVRLNVESRGDVALMQAKTQEVLQILES